MSMTPTSSELKAFQVIPGVGKAVAKDLFDLGFREVNDLRGKDPEELYKQLLAMQGPDVCKCMLYTLRLAVYFASTDKPDPSLLKWWKWKDVNLPTQLCAANDSSLLPLIKNEDEKDGSKKKRGKRTIEERTAVEVKEGTLKKRKSKKQLFR